MNKVILIGNLCRDWELKNFGNGGVVGNNALAVTRKFKNTNGEMQENTVFIDISIFSKGAEILEKYTAKGNKIAVTGKLEQQSWQDNNTGQNRTKISVLVEDFEILTFKDNGGGYPGGNFNNGFIVQNSGNRNQNSSGNTNNGYKNGYISGKYEDNMPF